MIFQFSKFSPKLSTYRWDTLYIRLDTKTKTCLMFATVILEIIISVTSLSGESLSDEEKDMEEDEKEDGKDVDEQDDDGFFVGHGVLDKNELKG